MVERDGDAFADDLKELTRAAGLSVREVARRTGISRSTVQDALSGRVFPRQDTVLAIVSACDADELEWRDRWLEEDRSRRPAPPDPTPPSPPARRLLRPPLTMPRLAVLLVTLAAAVALLFAVWPSGAHGRSGTGTHCQPARRYEVTRSGNLLSAHRSVMGTTQPGDVFYATRLNAAPYAGRHYGVLERTGQWGYIDVGKVTHPRATCIPHTLPPGG
jgi:transcriptional regulator with XRE-family HTH domain